MRPLGGWVFVMVEIAASVNSYKYGKVGFNSL